MRYKKTVFQSERNDKAMANKSKAREQLEALVEQEKERELQALYETIVQDVQGRMNAERSEHSNLIFLWNGKKCLGIVATLQGWEQMKQFAATMNTPSETDMDKLEKAYLVGYKKGADDQLESLHGEAETSFENGKNIQDLYK